MTDQARPADLRSSMVGRLLDGRYELVAVLGRGGMATVYLANQRPMDRSVAVKVLAPDIADVAAFARFERELRVVSRLTHANSVTVFDYGRTEEGLPYLVMEFLDGRRLTEVVNREAPLSLSRTTRIVSQICDALAEAHDQGVIHRDLKAGNIMLLEQHGQPDFVKVLDFGLAKVPCRDGEHTLTQAGMVVGTPAYMSPEQVRGDKLDLRSDLYSLGVVTFELLSGVHPYRSDNQMAVMVKHVEAPVPRLREAEPRLSLPEEVDVFLGRAMAKRPEQRPESALSFKGSLMRLLGGHDDASPKRLSGARTDPQMLLRRSTDLDIHISVQSLQFLPPVGGGLQRVGRDISDLAPDPDPTLTDTPAPNLAARVDRMLDQVEAAGGAPQRAATRVDEEAVERAGEAEAVVEALTASSVLAATVADYAPGLDHSEEITHPSARRPAARATVPAPVSELELAPLPPSVPTEPDKPRAPAPEGVLTEPLPPPAAAPEDEETAALPIALAPSDEETAALPIASAPVAETARTEVAVPAATVPAPLATDAPEQGLDPFLTSGEFRFFDSANTDPSIITPGVSRSVLSWKTKLIVGVGASAFWVIVFMLGASSLRGMLSAPPADLFAAADESPDSPSSAELEALFGAALEAQQPDTDGDDEPVDEAWDQPDDTAEPVEDEARPEVAPAPEGPKEVAPPPAEPKEVAPPPAKPKEVPAAAAAAGDGDDGPSFATLYNEGTRLMKKGQTRAALRKFEAAMEKDPGDAKVYLSVGQVYYDLGQLSPAIKHYRKAEQLAPRNAKVHLLLGLALQELGRMKEARAHYETYLKLAPDGKDADAVRGLLQSL